MPISVKSVLLILKSNFSHWTDRGEAASASSLQKDEFVFATFIKNLWDKISIPGAPN